ncbi:unnamed protein product [Caenorhabditis auriculariae]|uniref:Uncharacterized protein n=1 Tax=Caenorhabditis auriculariae TaxID=2777116 RepID=A0A8S1HBF3_9PELO|nr:unnamed protein product [Caenorhabditis auriculariae]
MSLGHFLPCCDEIGRENLTGLDFRKSLQKKSKPERLTGYRSTEEWDSAPVSLVRPKCHSEVMLDTNIPMSKSRQKPPFFFLTEAKKKLTLFD